ncbi:unnamed protein product [Lampetra planeri]
MDTYQKFAVQRRGDAESALAYRSALLALAKAAYPLMGQDGHDMLVLEKLLELTKELLTVLPADDRDMFSLKIARCIKAQ